MVNDLDKIKFEDICDKPNHNATIAHINQPTWFEIKNNTIVDYKYPHAYGIYSKISYEYEILGSFLENNNINVQWINCNKTAGLLNFETGQWTGAIGKVINFYQF